MAVPDRQTVRAALDDLEADWISLLAWLAEQTAVTTDQLVQAWSQDAYASAMQRRDVDIRTFGEDSALTVLNYLDFHDYAMLAAKHQVDLDKIGAPQGAWAKTLSDLSAACVPYRNSLSHGGRFESLPLAERQHAYDMLRELRALLHRWWPSCSFGAPYKPDEDPFRTVLRHFNGRPRTAHALIDLLGMRFVSDARNLVSLEQTSELARALQDTFRGLFRLGEARLGAVNAALYLAHPKVWEERSALRDRTRRRLARALTDHQTADPRWIALLIDPANSTGEAEIVMPRVRAGAGLSTVRAVINLKEPNRHHIDLLKALAVPPDATLASLTRRWTEALNVEAVTKRFYDEFRDLRDRIAAALVEYNADHPLIAGRNVENKEQEQEFQRSVTAFGTRLLSRILFLWFLQQKRWLGGQQIGRGSTDYLVSLFRDHSGDDRFFDDVLGPVFFDGLGRPLTDPRHMQVVARFQGELPYLGGDLFSVEANSFERRLFDKRDEPGPPDQRRRVRLPDALFDPTKDQAIPVTKKGVAARTVFGLLQGYRFTTRESTPDDQSLDPDPELLGKVFENLYQGDDRHASGSYYTPREIVRYMCREALDGYLREQTGFEQNLIDGVRRAGEEWQLTDQQITAPTAARLIAALDRVAVIDPAVGSGAFLIGMMQEIVLLRRGIEQAERGAGYDPSGLDVAEWKRRAIVHNLYGVDINPTAVEICHLRLWLSLIVDLNVGTYRDVHALPDLDLRIVAGDSLVDRMGDVAFEDSLPRGHYQPGMLSEHAGLIPEAREQVERLRAIYLGEGVNGDETRRRQVKDQLKAAIYRLVRYQIEETLARAEADLRSAESSDRAKNSKSLTARVQSLHRLLNGMREDAAYEKPFLWPAHFPEIFSRGGFDICIANPPYIRMEGIDNRDEITYGYAFPEVKWTRADILVYFYACALQILRDGGQLAFITSNKYMRAAYGQGVRTHLPANLQVRQVIDFGDLPVFDVAAYPAVLIGQRTSMPDVHASVRVADLTYPVRRQLLADGQRVNTDTVRCALESLSNLLAEAAVPDLPQVYLRPDGWILEDPVLVRLFYRLMNQGTPLGEYVQGRMYYGIKTGLNEAFVIDEATRTRLIDQDPRSAEIIKPWLRGEDIARWTPRWAGLHVIFTRRGTDIDAYPAIRAHLLPFKAKLKKRATAHLHPWWELQQPQEGCYWEFEKIKLIWPEFARRVRFCIDVNEMYVNNKCYVWAEPPPWVPAILNSTVVEFMLFQITSQIRGSFMQLYDHYVRRIPIVEPDADLAFELVGLVNKLRSNTDDLVAEQAIESRVRTLYGLTSAESRLIDEWFARRSIAGVAEEAAEPADLMLAGMVAAGE